MKILFIARTYPPLVGGMEKFAFDFYNTLKSKADVKLIANPIGKKRIIRFFLQVMIYLVLNARKFDIVHFNDAILSPLVPVIRLFSKAKITFTVHGLDIVYQKYGYQQLIIPFLRHADLIIPVSQHTKDQCLARRIPHEKLRIIPNGLVFSQVPNCSQEVKQSIIEKIGTEISDQTILLSLGRLIERKGHTWFINHVFTRLLENFIYLIAGDGPEYQKISHLIHQRSLTGRVKLLGYVSEEEKACLFQLADLFIMPNIHDENDQEGFGIVLLEAGSHGLPAIATNIEGITDAVIDGVTGFLVEEKDAQGFINAIHNPDIDRNIIKEQLQSQYDWENIGHRYYSLFVDLTSQD